MKVKNIGEEKEPTAQEFLEALKNSGKQIDVRRIPEPNGFGTGMESYPPEIEVGVVIM